MDRKFRLARNWSNQELRRIAPLCLGDVVNVSAADDLDKEGSTYQEYFRNAASYWITNYAPGAYRGFKARQNELLVDLTVELPAELVGRFDVVFNHTTLEHIYDFQTAFKNLCTMTRDLLIIVVPFAQVQHEGDGYQDYWRFAPTGLRALFEANSMSVVYESASPYSDCAIYIFFAGSRVPGQWHNKLPALQQLCSVGDWIGAQMSPEKALAPRNSISRLLSRLRHR